MNFSATSARRRSRIFAAAMIRQNGRGAVKIPWWTRFHYYYGGP